MKRFPWMSVASMICLTLVCVTASVLAAIIAINFEAAGNRDFISYWASGQLLINGKNPYELAAILRFEHMGGATFNSALQVLNPPVCFFLIAPLGFVSANYGVICWIATSILSLVISIHLLWILHGRRSGQLQLFLYCLPSVLACLIAGQIGLFLLLGVVLFLYLHDSQPFFAGSSLLLCCLKPHLFLLFGFVLLLWAIDQRRYRILAGFVAAILAALAIGFWLDPHGWSQYATMMSSAPPTERFSPNVSKMFRLLIDRDASWLQFVPAIVGLCWASWYFGSRHSRWNWIEHGSLLLLISVLCAPFGWFTDEAVLIPSILTAIYRSQTSGRSLLPFALIAGTGLIELLDGIWISSPYFVWTVPAWLAWYLYSDYSFVMPALSASHADCPTE